MQCGTRPSPGRQWWWQWRVGVGVEAAAAGRGRGGDGLGSGSRRRRAEVGAAAFQLLALAGLGEARGWVKAERGLVFIWLCDVPLSWLLTKLSRMTWRLTGG